MKKNVCFILIVCMVVYAYAKDGTEKTFSPTRDINWTVTSKPGAVRTYTPES